MEIPVKSAFCQLLFAANGGLYDDRGIPIKGDTFVRSLCDQAYDCSSCNFMQEFLALRVREGWVYGWECDKCIKDTAHIPRHLLGFYESGGPRFPTWHPEYTHDQPGIDGCTRCGWATSFLQLVLRKGT